MVDYVKFPLGPHQLFKDNTAYSEAQSILNAINGGKGQCFPLSQDKLMVFFRLKPSENKSEPHLYVDDTDNDQNLTHLKHGIPGGYGVILATYDSGILAAENPLTLNLEALRNVHGKISDGDELINAQRPQASSSSSRAQENNSNSGANIYFDFNFFCLCGAIGGVVLLVGALIANPVVLTVGACMLGAGAAGMAYNQFFSPAARDANESTPNSDRFGWVDI